MIPREREKRLDIEPQLEEAFARIFPLVREHRLLSYGDKDWDSLKHIELVSEVESVFGISLDLNELDCLNSFDSTLEFLIKRTNL